MLVSQFQRPPDSESFQSSPSTPSDHALMELQASVLRQQREAQLAVDWRLVAMALDRLFLVLTLVATVAITAVVLHVRPQLHNEAGVSAFVENVMDLESHKRRL